MIIFKKKDILETAENLPYECASICSFCSRMKRGRIYKTARQHGYNVLALGQHLDDLTERFYLKYLKIKYIQRSYKLLKNIFINIKLHDVTFLQW